MKKNKSRSNSSQAKVEAAIKPVALDTASSKQVQKQTQRQTIFVQVVGIAMIFAGIVLIVLPLSSNLLKSDQQNDNEQNPISETQDDTLDGIKTKRTVKAATISAQEKSEETRTLIAQTGRWRATDYVKGDIKTGNYRVQQGDTLWEISEAVYGSGFEWHKILNANKSKIGFLPNGSQALIEVGQILVIVK